MVLYYYELDSEAAGVLWELWFSAFEKKWGDQASSHYEDACKEIVMSLRLKLTTKNLTINTENADKTKDNFTYELAKFFFFPKTTENQQINYVYLVLEEMCRMLVKIEMPQVIVEINNELKKKNIKVQFLGNHIVSVDQNINGASHYGHAIVSMLSARFNNTIKPYLHAANSYQDSKDSLKKHCLNSIISACLDLALPFAKVSTYEEAINFLRSSGILQATEIACIESVKKYAETLNNNPTFAEKHFLFSLLTNVVVLLCNKATANKPT